MNHNDIIEMCASPDVDYTLLGTVIESRQRIDETYVDADEDDEVTHDVTTIDIEGDRITIVKMRGGLEACNNPVNPFAEDPCDMTKLYKEASEDVTLIVEDGRCTWVIPQGDFKEIFELLRYNDVWWRGTYKTFYQGELQVNDDIHSMKIDGEVIGILRRDNIMVIRCNSGNINYKDDEGVTSVYGEVTENVFRALDLIKELYQL